MCLCLIIPVQCWCQHFPMFSLSLELRGLELQMGYFSLKKIKAATRNFDPSNKIGEGGFGPVYKVNHLCKCSCGFFSF